LVEEREFEEGKVWEVVKAMIGHKLLGPDGYSMVFFQACWDVLKGDIMNVFHDFHARGKFKRGLSGFSTFDSGCLSGFSMRSRLTLG
jgi:hypothetical protein